MIKVIFIAVSLVLVGCGPVSSKPSSAELVEQCEQVPGWYVLDDGTTVRSVYRCPKHVYDEL